MEEKFGDAKSNMGFLNDGNILNTTSGKGGSVATL